MKLIIDDAKVKKYKLSIEEFLYLILLYRSVNLSEIKDSLLKKRFIINSQEGYTVTEKGIKKLISFNGCLPEKMDYEKIAKSLQSIYPEGKKEGTNYIWRDSTVIIVRKLKTLVEKYNCFFTEEQAIKATKEYVESFNNDFTYMQILKYFLLKTITFEDGIREVSSEFMSRIENN